MRTHSKVRPSNCPCCTKWLHKLVPSSNGREFLLLYSSKLKQPEPLAVMTEMRELRYTSVWSAYALLCAVIGAPCRHHASFVCALTHGVALLRAIIGAPCRVQPLLLVLHLVHWYAITSIHGGFCKEQDC